MKLLAAALLGLMALVSLSVAPAQAGAAFDMTTANGTPTPCTIAVTAPSTCAPINVNVSQVKGQSEANLPPLLLQQYSFQQAPHVPDVLLASGGVAALNAESVLTFLQSNGVLDVFDWSRQMGIACHDDTYDSTLGVRTAANLQTAAGGSGFLPLACHPKLTDVVTVNVGPYPFVLRGQSAPLTNAFPKPTDPPQTVGMASGFHLAHAGPGFIVEPVGGPSQYAKSLGNVVTGLVTYRDQPTPSATPNTAWQPCACDYDWEFLNAEVTLDVKVLNATKGAYFSKADKSHIRIDGQAFQVMVSAPALYDYTWFDINGWPYWTNNPNVLAYSETTAHLLEVARTDNAIIPRLTGFGYSECLHVGAYPGGTPSGAPDASYPAGTFYNGMIDSLQCDYTQVGVHVMPNTINGQFTMKSLVVNGARAAPGFASSIGVWVEGSGFDVAIGDARIYNIGLNLVLVSGNSSTVRIGTQMSGAWGLATPTITAGPTNAGNGTITLAYPNQFTATTPAAIAPPWTANTVFASGQVVASSGNIYHNGVLPDISSGTSGSVGPSGTTPALDGQVPWVYDQPMAPLAGTYTVTFTSPTTFNVLDPSGNVLGACTVGIECDEVLRFTYVAGPTPAASGDLFTLAVALIPADSATGLNSTVSVGSNVFYGTRPPLPFQDEGVTLYNPTNPLENWTDDRTNTLTINLAANGGTAFLPVGSGRILINDQYLNECDFLVGFTTVVLGTHIGSNCATGPSAGTLNLSYYAPMKRYRLRNDMTTPPYLNVHIKADRVRKSN